LLGVQQYSELGAILIRSRQDAFGFGRGLLKLRSRSLLGQIPLWLTGQSSGDDLLILVGMVVIQFTVVSPRAPAHRRQDRHGVANGSLLWILLKWTKAGESGWIQCLTVAAALVHGWWLACFTS